MNMRDMTEGGRIRVRSCGLKSPLTNRPVFRIEDRDGRVLRRISSARGPEEAAAHYWRATGADAKFAPAMPEQPTDASLGRALGRRIDAARTVRGKAAGDRLAMQTHELPLPGVIPAESDVAEADPAPEAVQTAKANPPTTAARRRTARPKPQPEDLFQAALPDPVAEPMTDPAPEPPEAPAPSVDQAPPAPEFVVQPEPVVQAEPVAEPGFIAAPEPEPAPEPELPGPYHLDPGAVMLQQVDYRNLRPTDRADAYLYHVTNRGEANTALENGLVVSAQDPIILTERPGVAYWLSVLAEDFDFILDGPADFVVLRMRRFTVEELLEADPHASRSAGCACYLLTGGPARGRDASPAA